MLSADLLLLAHLHGKPQKEYNFWTSIIGKIIVMVLIWWALGWKFIQEVVKIGCIAKNGETMKEKIRDMGFEDSEEEN